MHALKKFLLLTTALTVVLPCKPKAETITINDSREISSIVKQGYSGGIFIEEPARLKFTGGSVWDYSSYHGGGERVGRATISISDIGNTDIYGIAFSGDFVVSNGTFYGDSGVKMYKGHNTDTVKIVDETGREQEYSVSSAGDFYINGGTFYLNNGSELLMKKTATGAFYLNSGVFSTSENADVTIGSEWWKNDLNINGGTFNLADGSVMRMQGANINVSRITRLTGGGTLSFYGITKITTDIQWNEGTLQLAGGSMDIASDITVKQFKFAGSGGALTIEDKKTLTVKSNFEMEGNSSSLTGDGTLRLETGASAKFINLNFGTIKADGAGTGVVTFAGKSTVKNIEIDNGTLNVNSMLTVDDLKLKNNARANISAELKVSNLDFDDGSINFAKNAQYITLQQASVIKNTAKFSFVDNDGNAVGDSRLVIESGTLDFEDNENDTTTPFRNAELSVQAKENTVVNFNQTQGVDLDKVSALQATVNVNKGNSVFSSASIGNANSAQKGYLNIAKGATLSVYDFLSNEGSEIAIDGTLTIQSGETKGNESAASTFTGTGTLKVTGTLDFNGRFENFGTLQLDEGAVFNFGGLSNNAVGTVSFTGTTDAVMNINAGIFKANSLNFADGSKGSINIAAGGTLALDANGADVSSIIHGTGSIGGKGTLRLENNTSVSFGGNDKIKDLGTLEIGNGTATISGKITIGNVKFYQETGTLDISDGKTLSLKTITTNKSNKVTGKGTLQLTGTEKSTFGGLVSALGTLEFANGGVEFSNGGVSSVGTITGNGGNLTVSNGTLSVANKMTLTGGNLTVNGTLNVSDVLSATGGNVSGTGTLNLANGGTFTTGSGYNNALNKLIVGGTTTLLSASTIEALEFSKAAEVKISDSLKAETVSTVNGAILSGDTLMLTGTGTFVKDSVKTDVLALLSGARAVFAGDNSLTNLSMIGNASAVINAGATLTLAQDSVGAADSVITGAGTLALNKDGLTVNALLSNLGKLAVSQSATLGNTAQVGTLDIANGTLTQNADVTAGTVSFGSNGKLTVNGGKTLNITRSITAGAGMLNGAGTINLSGGANGAFATGVSFKDGRLIVGAGTASFTGNTTMASVDFTGDDGRLNIESGNTLTLAKIATKASNTVTGAGTLRLSGTGSTFNAPIVSLGEINIAGGSASFNKNANVGKLSFNGGSATVGSGAVLSISDLAQSGGTLGTVSGGGVLKINRGELSTGGNRIGAVYVGSETVSIADDSATGALVFEDENGTLNIEAGKTLTVSDKLNVTGNLTGDGTLILTNGGTFSKALTFGAIETGAGALTFYEDTTARKVAVGNGSAYFRKGTNISDLSIGAGSVFFNGANTKIGALSMTGAGKATFNQNASITNGATIGGTLDIGVTHLSVSNGLTFNDNSSLHLRLTAAATDDAGTIVDHTAYGKIDVASGKIAIGNNVNLDLTIDYGLHTATDGTEFQLVSGTVDSGSFTFANSRYKLEEVTCSSGSGFCYRLKETSNAEEIVTEEKGSQNNQNTAAAVLDGGLFNESDKMFPVASHLDALSQKKGGGRAYLNALTALAPDVSGAMTGQSVLTQTRVSKSVFNRLSGLQQKMGNRSEKYRQMRELYGRSGGSAYSSGLMRSADYYKRAGYDAEPAGRAYPTYDIRRTPRNYIPYDDEDIRPKRKVAKYRSQRQADYGAFYGARPAVGVWAQGLYNTNEYKSASKEDGFSADSTGVSMGLDVIFADVAAIGFGYARTTSDLTALQRSTDVSGDTFFLYGMYKPADWYLSGVVSSGKNTFEEQKNLSGLMVSDNYDTKTVGGQLMLGFDRKGWNPAFGLRYSSVSRAAHEDSVGQKIASFSNTVFSAVAETQKTFELSRAGKGVWSSDLSAGLVYDFSRSEDEATVSLTNGASYTVKGSDMDPYGAELGAAISYVWGKSVDLSARYNLDIRPEWFSHTLTATLRVTF